MEVDSPGSPPSTETRHRSQRERDITICFQDAPSGSSQQQQQQQQQRSIFAEGDRMRAPPYQRQETCRVFVEGEGEITRFDTPPYYYHKDPNANANNNGDNSGGGGGSALNGNDGGRAPKGEAGGKENRNPSDQDGESQSRGRMKPDHRSRAKEALFLDSGDRQHPSSIFQRNKTDRPAEAFMEEDGPSLQPVPYELTLGDSSEDEAAEDEEDSCLREIFPAVYGEEMRPLRLPERLADLFVTCLSVRGCLRMGPTAFRMFARKCRLNRKGMNNASIDILYIDMQRKWEFMNPDRTSGLGFQGFVDACMEIARRKFHSARPADMLDFLVAYCEDSLKALTFRLTGGGGDEDSDPPSTSLPLRRERGSPVILRPQRRSVNLFPRRTITSLEEETVQDLFQAAMLKQRQHQQQRPLVVGDVNNFMRDMRHRSYVPSALGLDSMRMDDEDDDEEDDEEEDDDDEEDGQRE